MTNGRCSSWCSIGSPSSTCPVLVGAQKKKKVHWQYSQADCHLSIYEIICYIGTPDNSLGREQFSMHAMQRCGCHLRSACHAAGSQILKAKVNGVQWLVGASITQSHRSQSTSSSRSWVGRNWKQQRASAIYPWSFSRSLVAQKQKLWCEACMKHLSTIYLSHAWTKENEWMMKK